MLRFFCWLLAKDYRRVSQYRQTSKDKITLFGSILLIPVILWGVNGYLMSKEIFGMSQSVSIITSLILSSLIFLIERSIILSTTNKIIARLRIVMGTIVAILGSLTMDEVIFKNDIDNMMQQTKVEGVDSELKKVKDFYLPKIDPMTKVRNESEKIWIRKQEDLDKEVSGENKNGKVGFGSEAKRKEMERDNALEDYKLKRDQLIDFENEYKENRNFAKKDTRDNFNDKGLLVRMKAMFRLIFSDWVSFGVFILYFTLVFIMEMLVIIMKKFTPQSPDEELERLGDLLIISKQQKLLKSRMEIYGLEIKDDFNQQVITNFKKGDNL